MEDIGPALFLGFTGKRKQPYASWLPKSPDADPWLPKSVEEVCTATFCQAETPEEGFKRLDEWYEGGLLSRESDVLQAIEGEVNPGEFEVFAYRGFALWFGEDGIHRELHPAIRPKAQAWTPERYELLGYDVLQVEKDVGWGCSPLSCNGMAKEVAVNRHCLIDRIGDAVGVGFEFGRIQPEPGEYVILEVWRRRADA